MYQTLYRKYRPKNFDEVVGQDVIVKTLKNEIRKNQLNHAYLFAGPRGTGKTSIAKILAKTINCSDIKNGNACDKCVNCTQINYKQSTDIIEIDAASNNGVDEIRELKSKVNLVPAFGKYKVYIIDEVHMLTIGAFNALLKTLEEPPAHVIFILATTDPHKIPSTILSRCQRFDFKKISLESMKKRLRQIVEKELIDVTDEALLEIARLSDGGMRDALSMLDQAIAFSENQITEEEIHEINGTLTQKQMIEILKHIINNNLSEELKLIDELNNSGKNLVKLTEELIQLMRNILLFQKAPNYLMEIQNNLNLYQNISREISTRRLLSMIKHFNSCLLEMKFSNNPKLILELSMIELMNLDENYSEKESSQSLTKNSLVDAGTKSIETQIEKMENQNNFHVISSKIEKENITNEPQNNTNYNEVPKKNTNSTLDSLKLMKQLEEIKKVRINNALAGFNKKEYLEVKNRMQDLVTLLINPEYSKYISMIFDATLKAYGNNYLIYVYEEEKLSDIFNYNIVRLEKIINEYFHSDYKLISVAYVEWEMIKNEFNSKKKHYCFEKEPFDIERLLKQKEDDNTNNNDPIKSLFGNIVEYEEE